jgi:arabinogalactan oligomer / maltooligosaccharide transport system substrate-binding protein
MRLGRLTSIVAGLALLVTAGCGGGDGGETTAAAPTTAPPQSTTAEDAKKITRADADLVIWTDDTRAQLLQRIADKFGADKGVKVAVQQLDFGDIRDNLVTQGPAGEGPDIIVGAHDWLGKLVTNGAVTPIELGDKTSEYSDIALRAMTYNGQLYGLPYAVENIALFRNTKLAPRAPRSWDDLVATGQKLVKDKKADLALALQVGPEGDPYHFYPLATSFGSAVFGTKADGSYDPAKLEIDNAGGLQFARALRSWSRSKLLSADVTFDIAKEKFATGKAPYAISGPWNIADFSKGGIDFAIEPIPSPGGKTAAPFVGVQGFMISAYAKNKLVANDFVVNYLGTQDVMRELYDTGKRPPAMTSVFQQVSNDPLIAGLAAVGAKGQPLPSIPEMDAVWAEYGHAERDILLGKGDPTALMKQAATKIRDKIGG